MADSQYYVMSKSSTFGLSVDQTKTVTAYTVFFVYTVRHAGVQCNERANRLASRASLVTTITREEGDAAKTIHAGMLVDLT